MLSSSTCPRGTASLGALAAGLLLALLVPGNASAQHAERYRPVVVTGDQMPAWAGETNGDIRVYAWTGAAYEAIPHQLDELVVRILEAFDPTGVPEHQHLTYDWDGEEDGTLDGNDELAFMPWDMGGQAPEGAWRGSADDRFEIRAHDPLTGVTRYAYAFLDPSGELSPVDYAEGSGLPSGIYEGERLSLYYEDRWLLTEMRVKPSLGGTEQDLIDRVKGRFGDPADPLETEDGWNESALFLGALDGPVFAAREVQGAASGLHTTHLDAVFARHVERTVHLRLHEATRVVFYFDLDPGVLPGEYEDPEHVSPLILDGVPHAHDEHPLTWTLASTPAGSLFVEWRELTEFPPRDENGRAESYHVDDETLDDFSGDVAGAHGNFGAQLWNIADTNESPYVTRQTWIPLAPNADAAELDEPDLLGNPLQVSVVRQERPSGNVDDDGDGHYNDEDNCPGTPNPSQSDEDADGVGDACDSCPQDPADDSDGDGVCDSDDLCPGFDDALDQDADGVPDGCDPCPADAPDDSDGDGVCDSGDLCPGFDDALDQDGDGMPDGCDPCPADAPDDSDGDGVCESADNCPAVANADQADSDGDGIGDACEAEPVTLSVSRAGADLELSWTPGAPPYRVLSSESPERASFTEVATGVASEAWTDVGAASDGRALVFYLVD